MSEELRALHASVDRLRDLVTPLDDAQLAGPAYPAEWSIAEVLSHVGSGAVIMQRRVDDALLGREMPDDFAPTVWDEWNAKSPRAQADDGLAADRAFIERVEALSDAERAGFTFSMGPIEVDFATVVGLRVNEHTLHTWDVEVALDPTATLPAEAAALIVDHLDLIARYTGRPTGTEHAIEVRTSDPERAFVIELTADRVSFISAIDVAGGGAPDADLRMPAEAFVRVVYGRLDADHAAGVEGDTALLDELRQVFPGP